MLKSIKTENKSIGRLGEDIAYNYLMKYGYKVLVKNFSCRWGEIDIIFKDKDEYVFAEVKTRTSNNYGFPAESVNYFKKRHIWNVAKYFLYKNNLLDRCVRFDIIEVYLNKDKSVVNHIENAFMKE